MRGEEGVKCGNEVGMCLLKLYTCRTTGIFMVMEPEEPIIAPLVKKCPLPAVQYYQYDHFKL